MRAKTVCALSIVALIGATSLSRAQIVNEHIDSAVKTAESTLGARVGVAVLDTGSDHSWFHRPDERFPMASTSKVLTCAALLQSGSRLLDKQTTIHVSDLAAYAPVTKTMVGKQVSASDLCGITMRTSDNTAVNKVLEILGGPEVVTSFVRKTGDKITRLDRNEPNLNEGTPGDLRDTTTPRAISATMRQLVLGSVLDTKSREQLTEWLTSNEVGGPLLRAGVPADWRIADRTGAGGYGTRGVVAVIWPPKHAPVVTAIYITETKATMDERNAAIATIGKAIASEFSQ